MDRSQHTYSAVDELRKIESDARQSLSLSDLRHYFERIQALRRMYADDFDFQLECSEAQELILERARTLRNGPAATPRESSKESEVRTQHYEESAEIPPDIERLDPKSWQRAIYIGLFFAIILFTAFFYLIQTARRLNMTPGEDAAQTSQGTPSPSSSAKAPAQNASAAAVAKSPTLRLYTDLVPGSVTTDNKAPQELKDGELVLDNLDPGRHSMKVAGRTGEAAFSYQVTEKAAPKVIGLPTATNAMAVLVSTEDSKAHLVSNVEHLNVLLDGKPAGEAGPDGLVLENLGTSDHDLQVSDGNDHQRFVLTYTPAPALTVYVKSDPSAGTVVVVTGQDGAQVYINNQPYRRETEHGQIRIPNLKVGQYTIRVHKAGFLDPPPVIVHVKKAEETRAEFHLQPVPQVATLQIKGALPGTMVYVDGDLAAAIQASGDANISNIKPGEHSIELRRDGAPSKQFQRTFDVGGVVLLSGSDVVLNKTAVENKQDASGATTPGTTPQQTPSSPPANTSTYGIQIHGEQIRKGGGFVPYHTPQVAGHYSFSVMNRKGGLFKHGKLQWYAGFENADNYVLFTLDGKHATTRQVVNGKTEDASRVPFNSDVDQWVQVELAVKPNSISARARSADGPWTTIGEVHDSDSDFTKGRVGFYIPGSEELAIADFRFSPR